jgi:hypothetical protein
MKGTLAFLVLVLALACSGSAFRATGDGGQGGATGGGIGVSDSSGGSIAGRTGGSAGGGAVGGSPEDGASITTADGSDTRPDLAACSAAWTDAGLGKCPCVRQIDDVFSIIRTACTQIGLVCNYQVGCGADCTCVLGDGDTPTWSCLVPLCY